MTTLQQTISATAAAGGQVTLDQVADVVGKLLPADDYRNERVLLIVPDGTRTAPVGTLFKAIYQQIGHVAGALDVLIALGTHQPMSEAAIDARLEITADQRREEYARVQRFNHAWDDPAALVPLGIIPADEIRELSG